MMKLNRNEKCKDVKGYEGLYAVTTLGRVWSYRRKRWIKPWANRGGYLVVTLSNKGSETNPTLHKVVATTFIPNPENKPQINHMNGKKGDCRVSNLEWVTARENMQHSADMGFNKCNKLSYMDKVLICQIRWTFNTSLKRLAGMFEVTPPAISYIVRTYSPSVLIA